MSLRDEMESAIEKVLSTPVSFYEDAADAALVAVRSHVNRLADALEAEARDFYWADPAALRLRNAAQRVRALCEEQTEDEK